MTDCLPYAQWYLGRYPKVVQEMRKQLVKKGYSEEDIAATLPLLERQGFLDDRAYAQAYLSSEVGRKGKPLPVVRQKLLFKGVDKQLLDELIEGDELELQAGMRDRITKEIDRLRAKGKPDQEIIDTLRRRGFAYELIKGALFPEEE